MSERGRVIKLSGCLTDKYGKGISMSQSCRCTECMLTMTLTIIDSTIIVPTHYTFSDLATVQMTSKGHVPDELSIVHEVC